MGYRVDADELVLLLGEPVYLVLLHRDEVHQLLVFFLEAEGLLGGADNLHFETWTSMCLVTRPLR